MSRALNDKSALIITDVPELRIIDQDLWERVKERQRGLRKLPSFHEKQRPRMLLSYLLKCGCCGGGFSKVSQNHYGCSTARNKGTCHNRLTVRQETLGRPGHRGAAIASNGPSAAGRVLRRVHPPPEQATNRKERLAMFAARGELAGSLSSGRTSSKQSRTGYLPPKSKTISPASWSGAKGWKLCSPATKEEPVLLHPNMAANTTSRWQTLLRF